MDAAAMLPPLAKIDAALRTVTETLAREVTHPSETPPAWNDFEWQVARAVASMQGISGLLAAGLRWQRPGWRKFLEGQRDQIAGRHRKVEALLNQIDSASREDGIALVALKGAALHASGIYKAGERPMADIDLLAQPGSVDAINNLLERCGYSNTFTSWRDRLFEPRTKNRPVAFGEHADNPIKIEVHTRIRERLPVRETDITGSLFPATASPGINDYPSPVFLMMHLLLHAAGNMRARGLRMIQLHDIAKLAERFATSDWEELLAARAGAPVPWWAAPPLMLTARYYADAIPAFVLERSKRGCSWPLLKIAARQHLTDVSWSNIRLRALPGIEWAQSPGEAFVFMFRRVLPNRETRLELKRFAAYHSGGSEIPWYGISQAARIVRWVFSRPPRVQTLLAVRAALSQRDEIR